MAVSVQPKIAGLDILETGIRSLKRSKLLVTREFKDMLNAVERHHNDLRLAHLTGKAKDLLEQAQRDTKFYNILVKMLCEVKEKRTGEQRQGLRRVYTWYMANKHVLNSGPHFGKAQQKKEAQEILVKATTPRKTKNAQSSRWGSSQSQPRTTALKNRAKSAPSTRITWRDSSFDWRKDLDKGILSKDQPRVERLKLNDDENDDCEPELQRLVGGETDTQNTPLNTADTTTTANTELLQEARLLSCAHHGSPSMTPLGEQSANIEVPMATPRKIVHPISSMVNPHVTLAAKLEQERQEKLQAQLKMGEKRSRADSLQAWQNFNKNRCYGQDIVDRLNFVGRSGTPNDVRYFAHGQAEMPELYTQDIISGYAQVMATQGAPRDAGTRGEEQKENVFVQQTLEEFYETADALYPTRDVQPMSKSRIKSAPAAGRVNSHLSKIGLPPSPGPETPKRRAVAQPHKLGHLLQDLTVEEEVMELGQEEQMSVKLDTVFNIIDSVSGEMTLYKERLAPEAQAGFRQPMATGLPTSSNLSSPSVRLPSPTARSNSPVHTPVPVQATHHPSHPRPYSSPLVSRRAGVEEEESSATSSPRHRKDRCKSAGVIDWRGRVQPDTMRYKWSKTKFGGYTYLKKHLQRPTSMRSVGSTSAGRRPKTAPVSIRDKWKTEKASDFNQRVEAQAASNSMTQINQQDMDTMLTVQYLLGTSNSRADSLASLYSLDEEFLRSLRRKANTPSTAPLEYMSFVSPSAGLLLAERRAHLQGQTRTDYFDDRQRAESAGDHFPPLPNLDDLHVPLGLGADIPEDNDSLTGDVDVAEDDLLEDHQEQTRDDVKENHDIDDDEGREEAGDVEVEEGQQQEEDHREDAAIQSVVTVNQEPAQVTTRSFPVEVTSDLLPSEITSDLLPTEVITARSEVPIVPIEVTSDLHPTKASVLTVSFQDEVTPDYVPDEVTQDYLPADESADYISAEVIPNCVPDKGPPVQVITESEEDVREEGSITYVTSVAPNSKPPLPASVHYYRKQPLSVSQVWQFDPSQDEEIKPGFMLRPRGLPRARSTPQPRRRLFCSECVSMAGTEAATPTTKVQRSAGRMPAQAFNTANRMLHSRHDELMRRAPPPRTPPSIPMPKTRSLTKGKSPRSGPMLSELEHHARKVKSPRSWMQHVKDLRSSGEAREISTAPSPAESLMGTLQVCRLRVPLPRQRSMPLLYRDNRSQEGGVQSILKQPSDIISIPTHEPQSYVIDINDGTQTEKVVSFAHEAPPTDTLPDTSTSEHFTNGLRMPETMSFMRQIASGASSLHSSQSVSLQGSVHSSRHSSEPGTPTSKNLARIGRPIAQVTHIPDPGEVAVAVQIQREAAAAVDIQRIFRGYVARNTYKKLLSDERESLEDRQRAAVEIQRMYRGHLSRRKAIKRRPPNAEMLEWAHNYRGVLIANQQQRQAKVEQRAEELSDNYHTAQSKLSVIGPHVNIYQIYHPDKKGPSKKELNAAAIAIQRRIRGWLIRRRFDKLHRKAAWYGSTFQKLVKDYKTMLAQVQRRHGVNNPQTPFRTKDMNDYIDTRRRYESVFEKKAFAGELELVDVDSFFKECDLYPSQAEIDEALDVAVRGVEGRGLKRHEIMDMVFYIYTPPATGLVDTRKSTWMNPIIDGVEAKRLIGAEFVEDAPLEKCAQLVIKSRRERREKEQAAERVRKDAQEAELMRKLSKAHRKTSKEEAAREEEKQAEKEEQAEEKERVEDEKEEKAEIEEKVGEENVAEKEEKEKEEEEKEKEENKEEKEKKEENKKE